MKFLAKTGLVLILAFALPVQACREARATQDLTIAAASSLRYVLPEIIRGFNRSYPRTGVRVIYGSSGKMRTQIANGAPFDLFFSANMAFARSLVDQGMTTGPAQVFALGRIAIWSERRNVQGLDVRDLLAPSFKRIAIANPVHAPYGAAARQALQTRGVWGPLHARLVFGENIGQAAHFALSGAVDAGLIAMSLIVAPGMIGKGSYALVPAALHKPIRNGFVIILQKFPNPFAKTFAAYLRSPAVHAILQRYGFEKPGGADVRQP
jgi:molybdate transport system substrate-binding protein